MKKERKENYIIFICLLLLISLSTMLIKDKQNEKNDELLANIETTSETITTTTETTTKKIVWDNLTEEELIIKLKENKGNFTAIGRFYGVTDNAVRKWCRLYQISDKSKDYYLKDYNNLLY